MKSKADKWDVDKLVRVPVDLTELCDVVKNDVVQKDVYAKVKSIEDKTPNITNSLMTLVMLLLMLKQFTLKVEYLLFLV